MIETDSQIVYCAIGGLSTASPFGLIVDDIKDLASKFEKVDFDYVKGSANNVAHVLSREACSLSDYTEWFSSPPVFIVDALSTDLSYEI